MTELETQELKTRAEVATSLRDLADQLDEGGAVTLEVGGQGMTLDPADQITFKLEGESEEGDAEATQSIELEMVWPREAAAAGEGTSGTEESAQ